MGGPIVRSGPSPEFSAKWDSVFGKGTGKKSAGTAATSSAAPKGKTTKKAATKAKAKTAKPTKKTAVKKAKKK